MFKTSNLLFIVAIVIFFLNFIMYKLILKNLIDNHNYSQRIVFNNIQRETDSLLNKLLFKYSQQKDLVLEKHKIVLKYLENHSYDDSLDEIYKIINKNTQNNPYNIYITNKDLIIKNTTFEADLDFDLNFAKDLFENHKKQNIIGVSAPVFETFSMNFFTFTDSYLEKEDKRRVLQVSYKYNNVEDELKNIQKLIDSNENISNSTAFVIFEDGYIGDFIFKSFKSYKPTLDEINERINQGRMLADKLKEKNLIIEEYIENYINYKLYYFLQKSPLFNDAKIIYSVIFDETDFKKDLLNLKLITLFLSFLILIVIYIIYKIRKKENLLNYKDKFIEHSVHEIKTPLSVIKLNNQLREKKLGKDKYSQKIEAAVKTLQNSYEDMSYLHTKNNIVYKIENLNIAEHLKQRINFFNSIALSQSRKLVLKINDNSIIQISKIEIDRLIDNNLSNAIKYSYINSDIQIELDKNILNIISSGDEIKDVDKIFIKYTRENHIKGGHGLGLSIVKSICMKYNISIKVTSSNNKNIFSYKFNCYDLEDKERENKI